MSSPPAPFATVEVLVTISVPASEVARPMPRKGTKPEMRSPRCQRCIDSRSGSGAVTGVRLGS